MNMLRRTRIVCTIGPSSASPQVMRAMVQAGMDVARLNFSHGDAESHRAAAKAVREAADDAGRPIALLGDLQGPKIRTGPVDGTFQRLVRGRSVALIGAGRHFPSGGFATSPGGEVVQVSHVELVQALRPGDRVLLDDGRIELAIRGVEDGRAEASVVRGGLLGSRKGISVPGRSLPLPALTEKDIEDLKLAVELEVDYLALSFVLAWTWGLPGVAVSTLVTDAAMLVWLVPRIAAPAATTSSIVLLRSLWRPVVPAGVAAVAVLVLLARVWEPRTLAAFVPFGLVWAVVAGAAIWRFGLAAAERDLFRRELWRRGPAAGVVEV